MFWGIDQVGLIKKLNITAEKFDPHSIDYDNITTVTVDHSQLQQLVNFTVIQTKNRFRKHFYSKLEDSGFVLSTSLC